MGGAGITENLDRPNMPVSNTIVNLHKNLLKKTSSGSSASARAVGGAVKSTVEERRRSGGQEQVNISCKRDDNFFLQMIRMGWVLAKMMVHNENIFANDADHPEGLASCKEGGMVVDYFLQFSRKKRMMIMLLIIGFNNLIVGAVLGRNGRKRGSRGGRTRPARPSYLVRQIQI